MNTLLLFGALWVVGMAVWDIYTLFKAEPKKLASKVDSVTDKADEIAEKEHKSIDKHD